MISLIRAMRDDRSMKAITGMSIKAFKLLLIDFEFAYNQILKQEKEGRERIRKQGGGRRGKIKELEKKLFFVLIYFKCYPTFDLMGVLFDMDRGRCNKWIHRRLAKSLEKALDQKLALPKRKIRSLEEFLQIFPDAQRIMIDGTERPTQRPKDKQKQKERYSGKKKRHTIKNLTICDEEKKIKLLTSTKPGSKHDYGMTKEEEFPNHIPKWVEVHLDNGFEGMDKDYNHLKIFKPKKKPKGKPLPNNQKKRNTGLSSIRVIVEHAIGGIKRMNIVSNIYRNRVRDFEDQVMLISSGLWNYHLSTG